MTYRSVAIYPRRPDRRDIYPTHSLEVAFAKALRSKRNGARVYISDRPTKEEREL
jgi:hypothetical protein